MPVMINTVLKTPVRAGMQVVFPRDHRSLSQRPDILPSQNDDWEVNTDVTLAESRTRRMVGTNSLYFYLFCPEHVTYPFIETNRYTIALPAAESSRQAPGNT